ncbi:radical SAM protein [Pseudomonadota bacterium]
MRYDLFGPGKEVSREKPIRLMHVDLDTIAADGVQGKLHYGTLWLDPVCNLRCSYCATNPSNEDNYIPDGMTREQRRSWIQEFAELGGKVININGEGEPGLDGNLQEYTELMAELDIKLVLTTNGADFRSIYVGTNIRYAEFLRKHEVALNVKLHGLNEEEHNRLVGENAFRSTTDLLQRLIHAGYLDLIEENENEIVTPIAIETIVTKETIGHLRDYLRFCRHYSFYPMLDELVVAGRADNDYWRSQVISEAESRVVAEWFEEIMGYPVQPITTNLCPASTGVFFDSKGNLLIDKNGYCCDAFAETSDLKYPGMSLAEIWGKLKGIRQEREFSINKTVMSILAERNDGYHLPMCPGMAATQGEENEQRINRAECSCHSN